MGENSCSEFGEQAKRKYSCIPVKKRMLLVSKVLKKRIPVRDAAEEMGLKITTARFIINKFKETGGYPRRILRKNAGKASKVKPCKQEFEQQGQISSDLNERREEQNEGQMNLLNKNSDIKVETEAYQVFWVFYPYLMI